MLHEIKHRFTGEILFSLDCASLKVCVEAAVRANVSLNRASLDGASLNRASLNGASLDGASLNGASLNGASLDGASLNGAWLIGASLIGAWLDGASLNRASLNGASLDGASLNRASLIGASLNDAWLDGAKGADLVIARTRILPQGSIIGWKKCNGGVLVKLRVPEEAKRSHAFGRKCRAEFVDVLEVIGGEEGISKHDGKTAYRVGERVHCDKWESDWQKECAGGIHFYITREEAEAHE